MVTPATAFRFTERELAELQRLGETLLCSRTDVIRYALAAFRDNAPARAQIAADNRARVFIQNLRTQYGANAVLELDDAEDPSWVISGQPVDPERVETVIREQGNRWVLDLIDPESGVGISNVTSWTDEDEVRHVVVPLRDLWVHSAFGAIGEYRTRQLRDGRPVVQITEDDGSTSYLAVGNDGTTTPLNPADISEAFPPEQSVGIGVRRESPAGPHLGEGFGGKLTLTPNLDSNKRDVIDALKALIRKTENGELDAILTKRKK